MRFTVLAWVLSPLAGGMIFYRLSESIDKVSNVPARMRLQLRVVVGDAMILRTLVSVFEVRGELSPWNIMRLKGHLLES